MCTVEGPWSVEQLELLDLNTDLSRGLSPVAFAEAENFIRDQGTFVINKLAQMTRESAVDITWIVSNLFFGFLAVIVAVVTTWDPKNQRFTDALPHLLARISNSEM